MKVQSNNSNKTTKCITDGSPFEGSIQIEVSIDTIYRKMADALGGQDGNLSLAHAIIGTSVENNTVHYIYNALHGFNNDIDFEIGDIVSCEVEDAYEWYDVNATKVNDPGVVAEPNMKSRAVPIGLCKVIGINIYAVRKLTVEWEGATYYKQDMILQKTTVDHTRCKLVTRNGDMA